jgi:hypothetical protein
MLNIYRISNVECRTAEQGTAEVCNDHFDIQNSLFDILRFKYGGPSYSPKKNTRKHPGFLAGTETGSTEEELV